MIRGAAWLTACLLLAACGSGGGGEDPNPHGFRFDISDYNQVVVVPLAAFREDRPTDGDADGSVQSALFGRIRTEATNARDIPFQADWDTLLGLHANGRPDDRIPTRFFLAYEVEHDPTSGACTVRIHVIEGLPYDPNRAPLATYEGSAMIGDVDRAGDPIGVPGQCSQEAAHVAFDALILGGHFAQGWSSGPPAHMGG